MARFAKTRHMHNSPKTEILDMKATLIQHYPETLFIELHILSRVCFYQHHLCGLANPKQSSAAGVYSATGV